MTIASMPILMSAIFLACLSMRLSISSDPFLGPAGEGCEGEAEDGMGAAGEFPAESREDGLGGALPPGCEEGLDWADDTKGLPFMMFCTVPGLHSSCFIGIRIYITYTGLLIPFAPVTQPGRVRVS